MLIKVKYLGATDTQPTRLCATHVPNHSSRKRLVRCRDYGLDSHEQSKAVAEEFCANLYYESLGKPQAKRVFTYASDIDLVEIEFLGE